MVKHIDDDGVVREIVEDGESIRCPVYLMDATQRAMVAKYSAFDADQHRPHHPVLSDQVRKLRASTRTEYLVGLRDAWKSPAQRAMPHRDAAEPDNSSPSALMRRHLEPDNAQARRDAAWASYRDRLSQAWCDPRSATAIERQGEWWRGGR